MPKQTGAVADKSTLLDSLGVFAASNGYTVRYSGPDPGGSGYHVLNLRKNWKFYNLMETSDGWRLSMSTSYSGGSNWGSQPEDSWGTHHTTVNRVVAGVLNYWFYLGANYLHVVVKKDALNYVHFGIGEVEKFGSYVGGEYVYGHYTEGGSEAVPWSSYHSLFFSGTTSIHTSNYSKNIIRADVDGTPTWLSCGKVYVPGSWGTCRGTSHEAYHEPLWDVIPDVLNSQGLLLPILIYAVSPVGEYIPLGRIKGMNRVDNLYIDDEAIVLTNWRVFPWYSKTDPVWDSGRYGITYDESV